MKTHPYYSYGDENNIIISNSSLSEINPKQGGYPRKFKDFISGNKEEISTRSLDNGKIIHNYIENKEDFFIDSLEKPTDKICEWVDVFLERIFSKNIESEVVLEENLNSESLQIIEEIHTIVYGLSNNDFTKSIIKYFFISTRNIIGYYKNRSIDSVINTFNKEKGLDYLTFKLTNKDKYILSQSDYEKVTGAINSLKNNKFLKNKLFEPIDSNFNLYKEVSILFKFIVTHKGGRIKEYKGKALIDCLHINFKENIIFIIDLKTTGKSIYKMSPDKELGYVGTISSYRYYRQLYWYKLAIERLFDSYKEKKSIMVDKEKKPISLNFNPQKPLKIITEIAAVETFGNYNSGLFAINSPWLLKGEKEIEKLIERTTFHIENNIWNMTLEEYNSGYLSLEHPLKY